MNCNEAIDIVCHYLLVKRQLGKGVNVRILSMIRSKYKTLCFVLNSFREFLPCRIGSRQGCMIRPFFFVSYLNLFIRGVNAEFINGVTKFVSAFTHFVASSK